MENYRGLCIGGPRDGEFVEHFSPDMVVEVSEELTPSELRLPAKYIDYERCHYKYRGIKSDNQYGFWLSEDISFDELMHKLMQAYADRAMKIKSAERHIPIGITSRKYTDFNPTPSTEAG